MVSLTLTTFSLFKINNLLLGGCLFVFTACLEDREFNPAPVPPGTQKVLRPGILKINEIQPDFNPDSGDLADWVEIFNPTDSTLLLEPGRFWISENAGKKFSFTPPVSFSIAPRGFLTIYFDGTGTVNSSQAIVCNTGNLSKSGEFVGFYYHAQNGDTILLDQITYPASPGSSQSYGRLPDGGVAWSWLKDISRNASNNANLRGSGRIEPYTGMLKINEIDPNGSPDWAEVVSTLPDTFTMKAGRWFFSDDPANKKKYGLPVDFTVQANAYLTVDCNTAGADADANQLRAKFSFSSAGETLGIYYLTAMDELITVDEVAYPAGISNGKSFARRPNLTGPFVVDAESSKGQPNP